MKRTIVAAWLGLAWIGAAAPSVAGSPAGPLCFAYDASDDHLLSFRAGTPSVIDDDVALVGLGATEELLGMDFFPANRSLYGVAREGSTFRVVRINTKSGVVRSVGTDLPTPPEDLAFGLDFNPTVDRIRVSGEAGSHFRLNPFSGAVSGTDTDHSYAPGDPSAGLDPQIAHVAYDRNEPDATATTLFAIDVARDALVQIGSVNGTPISPNFGQLFTVGLLGVDAGLEGGFDIEAHTGDAYAALRVGGSSVLYAIHLPTGIATQIGAIAGGGVVTAFAVPEPTAPALAALASLGAIAGRRARAARRR